MKKIQLLCTLLLSLVVCASCTSSPKSAELRVLTFNIRYDNPDDGDNSWEHRKAGMVEFITAQKPDIMGFQEVLDHQYKALKAEFPDYETRGVGREDGIAKGEYCPVFYRKDKFTELSHGHCWLSETPDVPGLGWDAACERTAVWVLLREQETAKEFLFINTHFDHQGEVARRESSRFILHLADSLAAGRPVVLTGDFNAEPKSEVVTLITDPSDPMSMKDSRKVAPTVVGDEWTFHDFGSIPETDRPLIDYIFVRGDIKPLRHTIENNVEDAQHIFLSDHAPVYLDFSI